MSMTSQDYAELADHCYDRKGDMRDLVNKEVVLEGVTYKVLNYVDNPRSGYQGTVYQRADSGEIIVAHRGTEFERERWDDLVKTDGAMVLGRTNPQAEEAIALTRWARDYAEREGMQPGMAPPEVTVTGHSLGGTLAQISAHHFDLRGETFNAYGAVSLNYRIPEGGDRMINHVTAADLVSSASPHYGQVRVYAMPQEIEMLQDKGYANNDSRWFDLRNKPGAAVAGLGSHDMHYFLNKDGDGNPDRSVLSDPATRELAREYAPMIEKYREDVEGMRRGLAVGLRGPVGLVQDGFNHVRGPLPAGEPAAREERERTERESRQTQPAGLPGIVQAGRRDPGEESVPPLLRRPEPGASGQTQAELVAQLLDAAGKKDPQALENGMQALWASETGQRWRAQVEEHRQVLESAQQQAPEAGLAR